MSLRAASWYLLSALALVACLVSIVPLTAQVAQGTGQRVDTVTATSDNPVAVEADEPIPVEQDRWIRLAILLQPVLLGFISLLGLVVGLLTKRADRHAREAAIHASDAASKAESTAVEVRETGQVHGRALAHVEDVVNSRSDNQDNRIAELTAALTKGRIPVPPHKKHVPPKKKKRGIRDKIRQGMRRAGGG